MPLTNSFQVKLADSSKAPISSKVTIDIEFLQIPGTTFKFEPLVYDKLSKDLNIGLDFMDKNKIIVDRASMTLTIDGRTVEISTKVSSKDWIQNQQESKIENTQKEIKNKIENIPQSELPLTQYENTSKIQPIFTTSSHKDKSEISLKFSPETEQMIENYKKITLS